MKGASFTTLMGVDKKLARAGVYAFSGLARGVMEEFYEHPTAMDLVLNWGRGSGKTQAILKITANETVFGLHDIPPGEIHIFDLSSRLKEEAAKAVGILSHYFTILGVPHSAIDGLIQLHDLRRAVRITAASVAATSGWRSYGYAADEYGKLPSEGALAVDAREVLASKRAMSVTHRARGVIAGTPMVIGSPFYEIVSAGTNERQVVSVAPTWIATDNRITEAQTRKLEPNERIWRREYGAEFGDSYESGYFKGLVAPCVAPWASQPWAPNRIYVLAIDQAFSNDRFGISVAHREGNRVVVDFVDAITPPRDGTGLSPTACLRRVREVRDLYRVRKKVLCDQFSAATLVDLAQREGLALEPIAWTPTSKAERFEHVRVMMRDQRISLPNDRALVRELEGIGTKLLPSGHERIEGRAGDDRVSALVLGASTIATPSYGSRLNEVLRNLEPGELSRRMEALQKWRP